MMYPSNFQKFLTFSMCSNQLVHQKSNKLPKTNKMMIHRQFFTSQFGNAVNIFDVGLLKVMRVMSEKHISNLFGLLKSDLCLYLL